MENRATETEINISERTDTELNGSMWIRSLCAFEANININIS